MDIEVKKVVEELIKEIGDVYEGNDWLVVKKYILKYSHPTVRKNFSSRDSRTKKHTISSFDQEVIDMYYKIFDIRLVLDEAKRL
jgi:hypothetical protein